MPGCRNVGLFPLGAGLFPPKDWYSGGIGYCGSVALKSFVFQRKNFDLSSLNVIYKPAGYFVIIGKRING